MSDYSNSDGDWPMNGEELDDFLRDSFNREFPEEIPQPHVEFRETNSAFANNITEFDLVNVGFIGVDDFLTNAFEIYEQKIGEAVKKFKMIKTLSYFYAEFERAFVVDEKNDPLYEKRTIHIPMKSKEIDSFTNIEAYFQNNIIEYVKKQIEEVMVEGSGFALSKIEHLRVQILKHDPLRGLGGEIKLPKSLLNKRSIVSLINTHNECFKWSILAALHFNEVKRGRNKKDAASYKEWAHELNFNGIDFPVRINQIEKFMSQNEKIAVNVYFFDEKKKRICPLFLPMNTTNEKREYIHLLLLSQDSEAAWVPFGEASSNTHYCWIKNLSGLVGSQLTENRYKKIFCNRCLNYFTSIDRLKKHELICINLNKCAIEMPTEDDGNNFVKFENYERGMKVPYVMYLDMEAILKKPQKEVFNPNCSTTAHQEHVVHSIGYYFKNENNTNLSRYESNRGENCVDWFKNQLKNIAEEVYEELEDAKPMAELTEEEERQFNESTICHICKKPFDDSEQGKKNNPRVRDHCHITGKFRFAAHSSCNLQFQISRTIPVVAHNLSGYDLHLIIKQLGDSNHFPGEVKIIPHNSEKYISVTKTMLKFGKPYQKHIKFKFIDSLNFMSASLDYLASLLPSEKKYILMSECIKSGHHSNEMFQLLSRKGVFPYDYIDNIEKLQETSLPSKEFFHSMLTDSDISEKDYQHAQNVWKTFGIRTLAEYSDLYLRIDVLLLADVFENFRNTCFATHSLDPVHYFGAPGLSFDAMLKYTNVSIELLTDVDMLMFVEQGVRGGVSQINKRYVKANNIYMGDKFDASKESSYIMYLDGKYIKS